MRRLIIWRTSGVSSFSMLLTNCSISERFQMAVSCIGLKAIDLCCHMSVPNQASHDKLLFLELLRR